MEPRTLLDALRVAERLKDELRHCCTSGGRRESVAEHSWRTALMAYLMKDEYPTLDMDKVIRMCLIHDMGEAVTGDIPTFEKTEDHRAAERHALDSLLDTLPEPWPTELKALFDEMEALETPEAKLYKSLDRMEAILAHNEADIDTWIPLEYDLNLVYGVDSAAFSPYTKALRQAMAEDTQKKIDEAKNGENS